MIVSFEHNFVFLRILKVGSTSSQAMLINSGILGDQDIYTGYRNDISEQASPSQNLPDITAESIRALSPYNIPKNILVKNELFPLIGHLTPTEIVRLGLLKEKALFDMQVVGVLREPIERFLSAWFFACHLEKRPTDINSLIKKLEKNCEIHTFLGKTQRNFFEYEEELLTNKIVWKTDTLNESIDAFVTEKGAAPPVHLNHKSQYRPDWSKKHYKEWLPISLINKLEDYMAGDFEFFNAIRK